jgi:hypothetical protein
VTPSTPIPDGSVIITPTEVYAEVRATREAVGSLARQLDKVPGQVDDHEKRLRTLERARWPLPSLAAVCGVGGLVVALWPMGH